MHPQTANSCAILLHALAKYQEVQERLSEEIVSVLGNATEATPQHLSQMPYLKGCISESFRYLEHAHLPPGSSWLPSPLAIIGEVRF
jgi:cytochrome P450